MGLRRWWRRRVRRVAGRGPSYLPPLGVEALASVPTDVRARLREHAPGRYEVLIRPGGVVHLLEYAPYTRRAEVGLALARRADSADARLRAHLMRAGWRLVGVFPQWVLHQPDVLMRHIHTIEAVSASALERWYREAERVAEQADRAEARTAVVRERVTAEAASDWHILLRRRVSSHLPAGVTLPAFLRGGRDVRSVRVGG